MWGALEKKTSLLLCKTCKLRRSSGHLTFNLFDKLCPETAIYLFSSKCLICNLFSGRHFKGMRYEFVM